MIIPYHDKSRKRKKKNLTKKLSIFNAYINFKLSKVSNSRVEGNYIIIKNDFYKVKAIGKPRNYIYSKISEFIDKNKTL